MAEEADCDIRLLPENVINKISAGEVINRPQNAVKELIENSIDAKSTSIKIITKDSGLGYIKITDNGNGIKENDFSLLCHRFATSKIKKFEDICKIQTFGFRGEALSSISNVSKMHVISRHISSDNAYCCNFKNGKMVGDYDEIIYQPQVCAGDQGTSILIENLFYNNAVRRTVLSNTREEFIKIFSIVSRYALHFCGKVQFSLKKDFNSHNELSTSSNENQIDMVKTIYKIDDSVSFRHFSSTDTELDLSIDGIMNLSSSCNKKYTFILFINDRLVDCLPLKTSILGIYTSIYGRTSSPFVYLSVKINPLKLDVNVHPAKSEVIFLDQAKIFQFIQEYFSMQLKIVDVQDIPQKLSQQTLLIPLTNEYNPDELISKKTPPSRVNRTDFREQTLESLMKKKSQKPIKEDSEFLKIHKGHEYLSILKFPRNLCFSAVFQLKDGITGNKCDNLSIIFKKFVFIGSIEKSKILLQHDVTLYVVDCFQLFSNLFYQIIIFNLGAFNYWKLDPPYNFTELRDDSEHFEKFFGKRDFLQDYFSINIDHTCELTHVPQILNRLDVNPKLIPNFMKKLIFENDYTIEKKCVDGISKTISWLYATSITTYPDQCLLRKLYVNELLPLVRSIFIPPKKMAYDGSIQPLTTVPDLYKIFERC